MRAEKESMAAEMRTKVKASGFVIVADYKGLSVSKTQELKRRLRGAHASMQVVKNRVFKHVAKDIGYSKLDSAMAGPSALVLGQDVVGVAKILRDFIKENEKPVIKNGMLQGSLLTPDDVKALAALPSREQLLSIMVGTLAAPMSGLVGVLQAKVASLLYVLKAIEEKKAKAAGG
jgi:large subunit ribosomal protein L10